MNIYYYTLIDFFFNIVIESPYHLILKINLCVKCSLMWICLHGESDISGGRLFQLALPLSL